MKRKTPQELAQYVLDRWQSLNTELEIWKTQWQDLALHIQPRKANIVNQKAYPNDTRESQLFTSTAIEGNQTLANGMVSLMTPVETPWFAYDPPSSQEKSDECKAWYSECTSIIQKLMAGSNFYTEVHEMFLDRGGFGTAGMHVEEGKKSLFNFTNLTIGTYAITENDEGYVDGLWRKMDAMTIRQAVQKFGVNALSEKSRKAYKDENNPKAADAKIVIIHAIYPREDGTYDEGKIGQENMPIASCYVEENEKHLIKEGGYQEMPSFVSRYLKWGDFVYGWSPAFMALPDARQLNFLEKMMDALAQKAAFPPMIAPASMEGVSVLDVRSEGVTYVEDLQESQMLREWQTAGRYDIGKDRVLQKQEAINRHFHVDLFRMFSEYDGPQMTAYEASLKQAEKLIQFSPTNTRLTTEFFNPLLQRLWGIAIRAGVLPPPPPEAIEEGADGMGYLPEPNITYTSRIALAIKSLETEGFMRTLAMYQPYADIIPDIFDNFDWDVAVPDTARNNGTPQRFLMPAKRRDEIRAQRAQAQQQANQLATAQATAQTVKDLGSVKPDSALAQAA